MALASRIVEFIQAAGGAAGSDDLVSHFGRVLQPSEMPLFKQLLRQVAQLQAAPGGGAAAGGGGRRGTVGGAKVWVLKAEWNADAAAAAAADGDG
jgi:DNA excision repair protein ERCC-6